MNAELKAMLAVLFNAFKLVEALVAKQGFAELAADAEQVAAGVPAVVSGWSDLMPEIQALSGASADADLLAFVVSQVAGVSSDAKAQAIIAAALDLALAVGQKGLALEQAIKS